MLPSEFRAPVSKPCRNLPCAQSLGDLSDQRRPIDKRGQLVKRFDHAPLDLLTKLDESFVRERQLGGAALFRVRARIAVRARLRSTAEFDAGALELARTASGAESTGRMIARRAPKEI